MISSKFGHHAIGKIAFVIALKNTVRIKIDVTRSFYAALRFNYYIGIFFFRFKHTNEE